MNENDLLRISLIGSIFGLVVLYVVVLAILPIDVKIGEVTGNLVGEIVTVEGEVADYHEHKNGHLFFDLIDETGKIKVVIWDNVIEELMLSGMNVSGIRNKARMEITGTIERYKGELELMPLRSQVKIIE